MADFWARLLQNGVNSNMALLIICPACSANISDQAKTCPACGHPGAGSALPEPNRTRALSAAARPRLVPTSIVVATMVFGLLLLGAFTYGRQVGASSTSQLAAENAKLRQDLQDSQARMAVREQQYRAGMTTLAANVGGVEAPAPAAHTGISLMAKLGILLVVGVAIIAVIVFMPGGFAVAGLFGGPVAVAAGLLFVVIAACLFI